MPRTGSHEVCPEDRLNHLLGRLKVSNGSEILEIDQLTSEYPRDARLPFLRGSLLAGKQDYAGAEANMRRALELSPGYAVARFQLGLLLLTMGRSNAAQETWGPLHALPLDHYLRLFVEGLVRLIHDRFNEAIRSLQDGISWNQENAPMNRDMEMIIHEIERARSVASTGSAASSVDLLLQQAARRTRKH